MIQHPYVTGALLFTLSIFGHGAGLSFSGAPEAAQIAGAEATSIPALGNSFQDMAVGVSTAALTPEINAEVPQDIVEPSEPTVQPTPETTELTDPVQAQAPAESAPLEAHENTALSVLAPVAQLQVVTPSLTPIAPSIPQQTPTKTVQVALDDNLEVSPRISGRPTIRPKFLEQEALKAKPKPQRAVSKPIQATVKQPQKEPPKQPKGNAQAQAKTGDSNGKAEGSTAATGRKASGRAIRAANAAVDNYPGQVMRRITRFKRPRSTEKVAATISFSIATNGGISTIGVAKSSGSPKFDNEAVALIRKANPFPRPPAGARTSYSVTIEGQ